MSAFVQIHDGGPNDVGWQGHGRYVNTAHIQEVALAPYSVQILVLGSTKWWAIKEPYASNLLEVLGIPKPTQK